ncbi:MAG TPA: copper chaperone PCu(A)C [Phenylobacterium sp.]|nr:copper chaperone PCu(A)C [Phenylobacterium sp.]HQN49734.1 copper chaperone PCu(A)C [Phenylobacterium sp.]
MRHTFALAALTAVALSGPAAAHEYNLGSLQIGHPWCRPSPPGAPTGAGYLTVTNTGKTADRLLGGTASFADRVEVHEMSMDGQVMRMRKLGDGAEIAPGATLTLKPGGFHLMFIGLKQPLTLGAKPEYSLKFAKAGTIKVACNVQTPPAAPMPGMDHMNHGAGGQ